MMKSFLIWCLMMVMVMTSLVIASDECQQLHNQLEEEETEGNFNTVTFDLNTFNIKCYSNFLQRIRNSVRAPTKVCGVLSTRGDPMKGKEYLLVVLKISSKEWITLGIDVSTLYIWAYQDNMKHQGKLRANFFQDAPDAPRKKLFPGAIVRNTSFGAGYTSFEHRGLSREGLVLGLQNLYGAAKSVYGKSESELNAGKNEAKFLLIVLQMVAEAVRFNLVEEKIITGNNSLPAKHEMMDLQNDWDEISERFHKTEASKPKCEKFSPALKVGSIEIVEVKKIVKKIAVIKFLG